MHELPKPYGLCQMKSCLTWASVASTSDVLPLVMEFKGSTREKVKKHCLLSTSRSCA